MLDFGVSRSCQWQKVRWWWYGTMKIATEMQRVRNNKVERASRTRRTFSEGAHKLDSTSALFLQLPILNQSMS